MQLVGSGGIAPSELRAVLLTILPIDTTQIELLDQDSGVLVTCLSQECILFMCQSRGAFESSPPVAVLSVRSLSASLQAAKSYDGEAALAVEYRVRDEFYFVQCTARGASLGFLVVSHQESRRELAAILLRWHRRSLNPATSSSSSPSSSPLSPSSPAFFQPLPGIHPFILHQGQYRKIFANAPTPQAFKNDLFEGVALLMVRTNDLDSQLYADRFAGNHYTFEVQVQGKFTREPPGRLFIGAEITKPMSLGLLTKGMCRAVLQVGKAINKYMHHSFGDGENQSTELPHIVGPMWSSADRLVVSKGPDATLPVLGEAFPEDAISRATRRKNADFTLPVDLDATYSVSFKTSNINLLKWTATNLPLVSNIDLHTFWSDAHLRTICYCVRDDCLGTLDAVSAALAGPEGRKSVSISAHKPSAVPYPKHHRRDNMEYLFCIEMQHESNQGDDAYFPLGEPLHFGCNGAVGCNGGDGRSSDNGSGGGVGEGRFSMRSPTRDRRHSATQNYLSYARATGGDEEECDNDEEEIMGGGSSRGGDGHDDVFFDALEEAAEDSVAESEMKILPTNNPAESPTVETSLKDAFAASGGLDGCFNTMWIAGGPLDPPPDRPERPSELSSSNPHCVPAAIEVDETRLVRQSVGQKGRRTLYAFSVGHLLEGKASSMASGGAPGHLQCVLRTYNEWQQLFPIFKRAANRNSSRLSDTEKRRQDLEMSFRVAVRDTKNDKAARSKLLSFLIGGDHTTSFLTESLSGVGLGVSAKRLRSDISFRLETLVIVQSGNKFWSEEFMGLTSDELVFIKPPNRLGISSRLCLRFESILSVENVDDALLPFCINGCSALKISTFSREYVVLMRGLSFRNAWQNTLQISIESQSKALVPHIDLLARPKCWKLGDRIILNARGFECASRIAAARSPDVSLLASYMDSPHILVARLTNIALSLAEQYDSAEDMLFGGVGNEDMQSSYISFMNGVSLLQRVDVAPIKNSAESTCLFLNLFHLLLLHAMLVVGVPKHEAGWISLYTSCSYEAFGDIFTLAELQQFIIEPGAADKDKYEFSLADSKDVRLFFALNTGSLGHSPVFCLYEPVSLSEQLDTMVKLSLQSQISIVMVDGSNNFMIYVPKLCKAVLKAFEDGAGSVAEPSKTPLIRFISFLVMHCDADITERLLCLIQQLPHITVTVKYQRGSADIHSYRFLRKLNHRNSILI